MRARGSALGYSALGYSALGARHSALGATVLLAVVAVFTSGHLGSPDTWFQGNAGPYPVRVVVRLPGVVPGLAQIDMTVTGEGVERVTAQPIIFDAGKEGAPPADVAKPVPGRPGTYHAELWFMTPGSFSVNVEVTGSRGTGVAVVPVAAGPERQIGMYPWLGKVLLALGVFLFVGAVTIIGAAGSDSVTPPGQPATARSKRTGVLASVFGAGVLGLGLFGGRAWWTSVEQGYLAELYRPFNATASVEVEAGRRTLRFSITDSVWSTHRARNLWERFSISPLVPDHGKLMHLFLMRAGDPTSFAHLHPVSADSVTFVAGLGNLPAGSYTAYADVVHETGFPQTMVATIEVPAAGSDSALSDPDDTAFTGTPGGARFTLPDRATVTWERKPDSLLADQEAGLTFTVKEPDGTVARLAPYLGMPGHAVVYRTDGKVYIHLHPNGTISMVAQQALGGRLSTDTIPGMLARRLTADTSAMSRGDHPMFDGTLTFPYAFPSPGHYRIWVQIRRGEQIATAPFDIAVK